jgi:hypothetical protein
MRIRLTQPDALDSLMEFLKSRPDAIVEQIDDDELEVSLLGSYNHDAMRLQLYLRVRAWEAAHRPLRPSNELDAWPASCAKLISGE